MTSRARAAARSVMVCLAVALPTTAAACGDDAPAVKLSAEGAQGKQVVDNNSCAACHTTNGDDGTGPTWKGLYGSQVTLTTGKTVTADAAYIERSIRDPNAQRAKGATNQMPTYDDSRITDAQIPLIVAYLKDLAKPQSTK